MLVGLALVLSAGVFQGSFMLPTKWMAGWAWENYWLTFALTAYLLCPWVFGFATVPNLIEVYAGVSSKALLVALVFGTGWGLGALMFGLGVTAVGLALGYAIILGVAATAGALIPLLVQGPSNFSVSQGLLTAVAVALMLAGVGICSFAGKWTEGRDLGERVSYSRGVAICVGSGLLSACGNLGFAFGIEVTRRAQSLGAPESLATNALWTLLTFPLFLCNAGYSLHLLRRNGTWGRYRTDGSRRRHMLGFVMGVTWMLGMAFYGAGARKLGTLGPSFGWAILMCSMVLVSNALGLLTGEWKTAPAEARKKLNHGIGVLVLAICTLGYANHLQGE